MKKKLNKQLFTKIKIFFCFIFQERKSILAIPCHRMSTASEDLQ